MPPKSHGRFGHSLHRIGCFLNPRPRRNAGCRFPRAVNCRDKGISDYFPLLFSVALDFFSMALALAASACD